VTIIDGAMMSSDAASNGVLPSWLLGVIVGGGAVLLLVVVVVVVVCVVRKQRKKDSIVVGTDGTVTAGGYASLSQDTVNHPTALNVHQYASARMDAR
jgi:hypothetical protein